MLAASGIIITVRIGLFARIEAEIAGLTERADRVEREAAFVLGLSSLAVPARASRSGSNPGS